MLAAGLIMAGLAWLVALLVDQGCFHNVAGIQVADPSSPRGEWCGVITDRSAWQVKLILLAGLLGAVIHLLPARRRVRWWLWCGAGALLIGMLAYFLGLEYSVNP